ncbi:MAG: cell wall-active antibiotics response protein [Treponema sp.]|nr:cell wall-active antibiotics response protein [Treponema sp.]
MNPLPLAHLIQERKEKAVESLSDSFAKSKLPLEEYERLVEYINKTESERELIVVEKIVVEYSATGSVQFGDNASDSKNTMSESPISESAAARIVTVLSSRTFSGAVKSGTTFVSILGDGNITIQKTDLKPQKTVLNVVSILGNTTIFVEPGINVKNNVVPFLGNAEMSKKVNKQAETGAPELIICGSAILGNVEVVLLKE